MSANCKHCEEGLAEWVMSYADMITILMAFFVVMYSMAGDKDNAKERAVLKSLRDQFGAEVHRAGSLVPPIFQRYHSSEVNLPFDGGTKRKDKNKGGAEPQRAPEGEHTRMFAPRPGESSRVGGVVFFTDNYDTLNPSQEQGLKLIAEDLQGKPQKIEIRGHTARQAGTGTDFAQSNWDLAYARTKSTMNYLAGLGLDPRRFRLSVAGDNEPLGDASQPSPHARSSRVEVFMLNECVDGPTIKQAPKGIAPVTKSSASLDSA